ncbi:hypothetical protein AHAT_08810 [Agarivorans sp. Toyoura001]|uniref:S1 family peptidase n=1 Tax=Agarivorans sp. Toyoura001 TaxID=2283141 RepID=UPI0010DB1FD5|nr:serine protease [Agarivorans sp. Toyoura001]GDY24991.1 hypothetical protein AHAT_08810 [Agarivorans sp. Toyoura001]
MLPRSALSIAAAIIAVSSNVSLASSEVAVPFIVGGEDAPAGEYPWMTQLKADGSYCGAVLINQQWVLSAAHCTFDQYSVGHYAPKEKIKVKIGDDVFSYLEEDGEAVSEVCQHPNYVDSVEEGSNQVATDNDIVLLRLAEPSSVTPITMNQSAIHQDYNSGFGLRVIGFGRTNTDPDNPTYKDNLQQANVNLMAQNRCAEFWGSAQLTAQMFCAESFTADSCSGDSGGPIFIDEGTQYKLAGLVSWGSKFCENTPGVYVDVGQLSPWITEVINSTAEERSNASLCSQKAALARPESSGGGAFGGIAIVALLVLRRFRRA